MCLEGSDDEALHQPHSLMPVCAAPGSVHSAALPLSTLWDREAPSPVILWLSSGEGVRRGRTGAGFASSLQHQPAFVDGQR